MKFDLLYEIGGEVKDGGELAEQFLELFLEDVDGLDHTVKAIHNNMKDCSVTATIETRARVTDEWFENADWAVKA